MLGGFHADDVAALTLTLGAWLRPADCLPSSASPLGPRDASSAGRLGTEGPAGMEDPSMQHPLMTVVAGDGEDEASASRRAWAHVADGIAKALTVTGLPWEERAALVRSYRNARHAAGQPALSQLQATP